MMAKGNVRTKRGLRGQRPASGRAKKQIKRLPDGKFAPKGQGAVRVAKAKPVQAVKPAKAVKAIARPVKAAQKLKSSPALEKVAVARKTRKAPSRQKRAAVHKKYGTDTKGYRTQIDAKVVAIQRRKEEFNKKYKAKLAAEKAAKTEQKAKASKPKATKAAPKQSTKPPAQTSSVKPVNKMSDESLAKTTLDAAKSTKDQFGGYKVFISDVYSTMKKKHPDLTLEEFKKRLVGLNRNGLITLGRADMAHAMDQKSIARSEIKDLVSSFHFIYLD